MPSVKGYQPTLGSIFKFKLPEILESFVLRDLVHSFSLKRPLTLFCPPSWNLGVVLSVRGISLKSLWQRPVLILDRENLVSFVFGYS